MQDAASCGPIEVIEMELAVQRILEGAGVNPLGINVEFLRDRIHLGMRYGFSAHEIVAFIAHDWPDHPPERAGEAKRLFRAAWSAAQRGAARPLVVDAASEGHDMDD